MIKRTFIKTAFPFEEYERRAVVTQLSRLLAMMSSAQATMLKEIVEDDNKREFLSDYLKVQAECENEERFYGVAKKFVDCMIRAHKSAQQEWRKTKGAEQYSKATKGELKSVAQAKRNFIYELAKKFSKSDLIEDRSVQSAAQKFLDAWVMAHGDADKEEDSKAQG